MDINKLQKVVIAKEASELALRGLAVVSGLRFGAHLVKTSGFAVGLIGGAAVSVMALSVIDGLAKMTEEGIMKAVTDLTGEGEDLSTGDESTDVVEDDEPEKVTTDKKTSKDEGNF